MRQQYLLFTLMGLLMAFSLKAQYKKNPRDAGEILESRKEVFFKFQFNGQKQVLTKAANFISIDKTIEDNWAYAYANAQGFAEFKELGLNYTLLYNPSQLIEPEMWSPHDKEVYDWDEYPTYEGYVDMMNQFETDYPDLCEVDTIGTTVEGRKLLVAKISDNLDEDENEPEFFYTSTMHGDETAGYVLMLRYIDHLLTNYGENDRITDLVDNMEIYVNPNANPDGTYAGGNNTVNGATRYNANGVDLNRNYPDPDDGQHPDGNEWQPETVAFMDFADQHDLVMSANMHGGAEVVNYPWDTWEHHHADHNWYQFISHEYADTAQLYSPSGYMNEFNDGVTNGYDWYSVSGGRQDYMNYFQRCREVTIELSQNKLLPESQLDSHWEYNYRSFLNYMEQATYGISGVVTDAETSEPVMAEVFVEEHDEDNSSVFTSMPVGNYYRPIEEGTFDITFSSECYENETIEGITMENHSSVIEDVELTPLGFSPGFSASDTNVQIGTEVQFTDESCGNPTSWEWTFEGGTPSESNEQNPVVIYEEPGTYDVTLTISEGSNEETLTKEGYISASALFNMANETVTTCQGLFYDDGGPDENYSDDADYTMTFYPAEDNAVLAADFLSFSVEAEANCNYDWLKIYDGESTSGELIGTYCGTDSPGTVAASNASGALTFEFHSDGSVNQPGWEAQLSCEAANLPPEADFEASQTLIIEGEQVEFTDLSSNNPSSWSWTFEGGDPATSDEQNPTVTYHNSGNYTVELVATNEAGSDTEVKEDYISVGVNTTNNLDNQSEGVKIYPNPNRSGQITIQAPIKLTRVELVSITGKVIKVTKPSDYKNKLNVGNVDRGIYILRLHSETGIINKKVQVLK
ncbi:MAG: PKD domain-containing protein [Bacteroidales bacterium]|nr:PKD domain-containing protein [Bacteroidales bacterium]MCF8333689.1 PKD domain-containing protein [Bacteroidales bacterium]